MNIVIHPERVRCLNHEQQITGPVIYWMSREHRIRHNWAYLFASQLANCNRQLLLVLFNLVRSYPGATFRHYDFMLQGLIKVEKHLRSLGIPFFVLTGDPAATIPHFIEAHHAGALVSDFSPLKISRAWKEKLLQSTPVPLYEVDAHNIVPCWIASTKEEYSARTIRPKINGCLDTFLTGFPAMYPPLSGETAVSLPPPVDWKRLYAYISAKRNVEPVSWIAPGEDAAMQQLAEFISNRLQRYAAERNDPTSNAVSHLSPYLHFGQISAQHAASAVKESDAPKESKDAFLEELVVRRELAENYCFYNSRYDSLDGIRPWAGKTLEEHCHDKREYIYNTETLEEGSTHDPLWNAAQTELREKGKMHGYLRMYWAKKILEWTPHPETAFDTALYLNDTYSLDGRDPNGYTGIAWSIGGVHDRPWFERPVFGKIRYMSYNGCKRKFNVDKYITLQGKRA